LEISAILGFENIFDYQKIYAIIYDCPFIAVIHTYEVSLKLWIGMANLQFPYHHIIVDWQKQYKN